MHFPVYQKSTFLNLLHPKYLKIGFKAYIAFCALEKRDIEYRSFTSEFYTAYFIPKKGHMIYISLFENLV
jgi:hypothetical protein